MLSPRSCISWGVFYPHNRNKTRPNTIQKNRVTYRSSVVGTFCAIGTAVMTTVIEPQRGNRALLALPPTAPTTTSTTKMARAHKPGQQRHLSHGLGVRILPVNIVEATANTWTPREADHSLPHERRDLSEGGHVHCTLAC